MKLQLVPMTPIDHSSRTPVGSNSAGDLTREQIGICAYAGDPQDVSEALNRRTRAPLIEGGTHEAPNMISVSEHIAPPISRREFRVDSLYSSWQSRTLKASQLQCLDSSELVHHASGGSIRHNMGLAREVPRVSGAQRLVR